MALPQSSLSELLEAFRAGDGVDLIRDSVRVALQADYVAAAFRMIFAQPTPADVAAAWGKTRDELAARFPKLGPLMDEAKAEVLAFTDFLREHWRKDLVDQPA